MKDWNIKIPFLAYCALIFFFLSHIKSEGGGYPEKYYQNLWCTEMGGIQEYVLHDKTRIDCLLPEYAVEIDFAHKWAESIGQALYYSIKTNRKPAIAIIIRSSRDKRYLERLQTVAENFNITIFIIKANY